MELFLDLKMCKAGRKRKVGRNKYIICSDTARFHGEYFVMRERRRERERERERE